MALPPNPLINGNEFDFASIVISTTFGRWSGIVDISYSDSIEVGGVYGTNRKRLGRTGGQVSHEASFTMLKSHFNEMTTAFAAFGVGYGMVPFDVTISYAEVGQSVITDVLKGCRITGTADTHAEGTEALRVAVTLDVMDLLRNGQSIVTRPAI